MWYSILICIYYVMHNEYRSFITEVFSSYFTQWNLIQWYKLNCAYNNVIVTDCCDFGCACLSYDIFLALFMHASRCLLCCVEHQKLSL